MDAGESLVTCMPVTDFKTLQIMCFFTLEKRRRQLPVNCNSTSVSIRSRRSLTAIGDPSYVTSSSTCINTQFSLNIHLQVQKQLCTEQKYMDAWGSRAQNAFRLYLEKETMKHRKSKTTLTVAINTSLSPGRS